jgi:hypothetical protein
MGFRVLEQETARNAAQAAAKRKKTGFMASAPTEYT